MVGVSRCALEADGEAPWGVVATNPAVAGSQTAANIRDGSRTSGIGPTGTTWAPRQHCGKDGGMQPKLAMRAVLAVLCRAGGARQASDSGDPPTEQPHARGAAWILPRPCEFSVSHRGRVGLDVGATPALRPQGVGSHDIPAARFGTHIRPTPRVEGPALHAGVGAVGTELGLWGVGEDGRRTASQVAIPLSRCGSASARSSPEATCLRSGTTQSGRISVSAPRQGAASDRNAR